MPKVSKVLTDKQKKKYIESGYNGCPKCGVEFDEKYEFTVHPGFGGHDF